MSKSFWLVIILLFLGFVLRIIFLSFTQSELVGDMYVFVDHARRMLSGEIVSDCCAKNAGYALFLAAIGFFAGVDNIIAVRIVQITLDLLGGVIVYGVARKLFSTKAAMLSFGLYVFNPITSSFVGLRLPEIATGFVILCVLYLLQMKNFRINFIYWILLGALLGLLVFFRMAYLWFAASLTLMWAVWFFRKIARIFFIIFVSLGFIFTSMYTLTANYRDFGRISVVAPTNFMYPQIYLNFIGSKYAELLHELEFVDKRHMQVMSDYFLVPTPEVPAVNQRYKNKILERIGKDWPIFLLNYSKNMVWIWDKYHLSVYSDPFYPMDKWILRTYNLLIFLFFFIGIGRYLVRQKGNALRQPVFILSVILFFYITFVFSLFSNESRHSVGYYGILFLWAGYGIWRN